ncbi:hypothetical protein [Enterovibrio baiacu]|uniref:hypothetical protein n=1 Tax=Enterovibrio baiacu TaxID=2491023 RepID=UPI003D100B58
MRCSSCGDDFPVKETSVIDSSRYCSDCKNNLFAPSSKKMSEKLVETLEKKEKAKVKTNRVGRVEYLFNSFGTWIILPALINSNIPKHSDLRLFHTHVEASTHLSVSITPLESWLWLLPVIVSLLFTMGRVKDLNWPINTAFLLWTPLTTLLLFLIPGTRGENGYGLEPKNPNIFISIIAVLASIPYLVLVVLLTLGLLSKFT